MDSDLIEAQERQSNDESTQRATFIAWDIEDCLEDGHSVWAITRRAAEQKKMSKGPLNPSNDHVKEKVKLNSTSKGDEAETDDLDTIKMAEEYWAAMNPPPNIHIAMDSGLKK
jgi:hypothetical protein